MERIYRTNSDLEVVTTGTNVKCPYCNYEWLEHDSDECGKTYVIECEECKEKFEMNFDAD